MALNITSVTSPGGKFILNVPLKLLTFEAFKKMKYIYFLQWPSGPFEHFKPSPIYLNRYLMMMSMGLIHLIVHVYIQKGCLNPNNT